MLQKKAKNRTIRIKAIKNDKEKKDNLKKKQRQ